jgi:hypothetical protein
LPDAEARHLERIPGGVEVTQDPMRDREQAIAQLEREGGERLSIASPRLFHQESIQHCLREWSTLTPFTPLASRRTKTVRSFPATLSVR